MNLDRIHDHREALRTFHNAYLSYLAATDPNAPSGQAEQWQLRAEATALMPAAQEALIASGMNITITPPPLFGGPILTGIPNTAFAHERLSHYGDVPGMVLQTVRLADGYLEEQEKAERRRRARLTYWPDRILRAVLGLPAYLLSLILGVPFDRIDRSPWGTALRLAELVFGALGAYFGGRSVGWW